MRKSAIALLLAALMISSTACQKGGTQQQNTEPEAAAQETSINVATETAVLTMDSTHASDSVSIAVIGNVQEGLYCMDSNNAPAPALAKDMSVSEDGLTYTFTLREDAVWSNGTPVTAADFVYSWQRLADPAIASENEWMMELIGVSNCAKINAGELLPEDLGVSAPDEHTFVVTLDAPCAFFKAATCFSAFLPLNEAFVEEKGDAYGLTAEDLLFNGAYAVDSWDVGGDTISIEKNETYYDASNVEISKVNFKVIADKQEAVMAFENGEIDYTTLSGTLAQNYKDNENFKTVEEGSVTVLMCNFEAPGIDNQNFRMALGYAIDRQTIVDSVLNDGSRVIGGVVPAGLVSNSEGKDYREFAGSFMDEDKELAKQYWEAAKSETDKRSFTLLYDDTETNGKVAAFIQSELEGTLDGLSVELQAVPKKSRIEMLGDGNYEVCLMRWGPDYADPITILSLYDPRNTSPSYSRWTSDRFLELFEKSNSAEYVNDEAGRWSMMKDMEQDLVSQGASLPLYQVGSAILMRSSLKNAHYNMCGTNYYYKAITTK